MILNLSIIFISFFVGMSIWYFRVYKKLPRIGWIDDKGVKRIQRIELNRRGEFVLYSAPWKFPKKMDMQPDKVYVTDFLR